jgi:photosystem II oxygen-evolving enhancer protein 2
LNAAHVASPQSIFPRPAVHRLCAGFIPYTGEGFAVLLPSKYNPSKEKEFKGTVLRYEDNGDTVNNVSVMKIPTSKSSIEQYGSQDEFLKQLNEQGLFGKQAYTGIVPFEFRFLPKRIDVHALVALSSKFTVPRALDSHIYLHPIL